MEELDEFGIPIKKTAKSSPAVDEFGIPIKKKDSSTGTVTPKKLVSEPQNGSSGGKGFPKIDTNSVAPGYGVQPKVSVAKNKPKSTIVNLEKPKEDISFFDYLKDNLDTGLANVSKSLYDAPGFIYDVAASVTNPVFEAFGVSKDKLASSDKLADDLGFRNIPSEILKEKIKVSNDKINAYAAKNGGDAFAALENGNYSGAAKLVAGSTVQSLPIMVAAMASGGQTTALSAIGLSTASTKNAELKESNPEMGLGTRVTNAANAGIIEAVTGHLFTGASGAVMKKILAEKGVEAGSKIISKSLRSTIEKSIEKNPFVGALGEVVEESAVEFGDQLNDMSSGIRTEFDVHAIKNAGLSATGMGGLQTLGVYGAKGYVKAKDYAKLKATNKEVFKLRGEIVNGNLSDENKALLTLRADRLEAGNKKLLGTEIEKVKALPTELKTELNALNVEFESLKSKFDDIDDADDVPDNLKPAMKEEIKVQASLNQKRKIEILSQNDGLIVDNDFSNFDGVDPDFDLENGKISSLPLKEQDRLNKLAVEQITGGDKTIEYTKEQVSQTANEIYKNEQNPEANQIKETVSEVSPVPSVSENKGVLNNNTYTLKNGEEYAIKIFDGINGEVKSFEDRKNNDRLSFSVHNNKGESIANITFWKDKDGKFYSNNTNVNKEYRRKGIASAVYNYAESLGIDIKPSITQTKMGETFFNTREKRKEDVNYSPTDIIKEENFDYKTGESSVVLENNVTKNEGTPTSNTPTDGNLPIGADNVGENGITKSETPIAESVPSAVDGGENKGDAEVSDLDHAKSQIDKGVLNWNGDTGAERVNLGIPWADIRKGEKDIKAGKVDTAPAKKLIEALKTAKENGGYEYKQGSGGQIQKQFVSLEDIQRSNNEYELTDAEQKEVDASEFESAREYDKKFNSLSEQEQIEILENYENSQNDSGTPSADSGQSQSKNDVSSEKEGTGENSGAKEKIDPKEADNDFKSKSGKKSLLNRAFEGGNSQIITDAIEANGLDYKIENREEAKKRAQDFVNEVGTANALEAVRSNQIKGAEKAFVYSTIVDNLMNEIENATNESDRQELEKIHADLIADLTNEFSQEGTDAGRFISALNDIYNSSTLKYNLSKQIESHKAANNGVISDEVLAKFTEADKRIKELEKLIQEAEAKAKVAEDELAVKNVQEDIERKKQLANKNKSGLTPREQTRKKELKNKFFGRLNDATSMITMLADPDFREYLGLTFKQAKGDLANFSKRIINELGKGAQSHLPQLFDEAQKSAPGKSNTIKIGKDGKIKIPAQLFRDYVEAGENDIDVIAAKIKEDIADEFPDADVRDIRDALTGYGKQINPTKDDVSIEIARLKSLGKLISAYEDASNGENPLKSGLKRAKPTQEMRELRKEINRIIKENGLDAVDLEKQWASALDKIKSQLTNQIEDLDKQIANGEKRKVERTTTPIDAESTALKEIRDAKKQILDDLVGKPELTEEQLIARAEKSLEGAIDKLQKEIAQGQIAYKEKPTTKQSVKLEELRKKRKELVETRNQLREQAGLVEGQRLNVAKKRVRKQIEDLNQRIADKDYSKKVVKPLIEDTELSQLRAEKLRQQEVYDAQKYKDELENRTTVQKWTDAALEVWNIERIIRATGELSTVLIQGGILTVSRKFTNPKEFAKIMKELFTSLGSAKKAERMEGLIKAHPDYLLSQKAKLALANTDYKSDVREEQFTGDYANFAWDLPLLLSRINPKFKEFFKKERTVLGDAILNPFKKATGLGTVGTEKISINNQWKNSNPFRVLERGSTLYMNTLRMEEFVRGCEMLRMEGKNEIDHLADYKLLANAINSMTGRANLPSQISTSSKALAVVFFSARNAVSVVNQVNPIYYGYLHFGSTDGFQLKKTSVANKLAMTNFLRFVTITGAMIMAIKAGAGEDEEGEDVVQIETDPRSSDFMKMKIGNIRFDPWHGMTGPIVLMAKVLTEEVKNINSGKIEKLEDKRFGDKNRFDLLSRFVRNKFSPSAARLANTLSTNAGIDEQTGEAIRVTPFGENYEVEGSFANVKPMYWDAVKEIQKEDPGALAEFLTVVSVMGWNTSVYGQVKTGTFDDDFVKEQAKRKAKSELPLKEKVKEKVDNRLERMESKIKELEGMKLAQKMNIPFYTSSGEKVDVSDMDFSQSDEGIKNAKKTIEGLKKEYEIKDKK